MKPGRSHTACRRNDVEIQRRLDRGTWRPSLDTGHIYSTETHKNLREALNPAGYPYIVCGKGRHTPVSRVIWIAAHGIPDYGMEVDHINGNKLDNRLENLQLVTPTENLMRSHAVLTFDDAEDIRLKHADGKSYKILAEEYGVAKSTIYGIVSGKTYKSRPPHEKNAALAKRQMAALDPESLKQIRAEYAEGASYRQISERRRIAVTTVKLIIRNAAEVKP